VIFPSSPLLSYLSLHFIVQVYEEIVNKPNGTVAYIRKCHKLFIQRLSKTFSISVIFNGVQRFIFNRQIHHIQFRPSPPRSESRVALYSAAQNLDIRPRSRYPSNAVRGRSSVVERLLAKEKAMGSNPIARSDRERTANESPIRYNGIWSITRRRSQVW
jgi:hypothetical protein